MKRFIRWSAALAALLLALLPLTGCGGESKDQITVRYLNFKPEIADKYQELATAYEQETGVKVIVDTAANNTYEQTLMAKMSTNEAPTLFQINGPRGYANWRDYCADLKDTQLYAHLADKTLAVTDGDKVVGIPYVVEGYGIIYNTAVTDRYFALADRQTAVQSMDEIRSFASLRTVVEDMQAHKAQLGLQGVFASTSLKSGEDWRWQTHLANVPVYYEFKERQVDLTSDDTKELQFQYAEQFKSLFDLYIHNSVTEPKLLGSKTVTDSMSEFALEQCAMVQNGNWAWSQIQDVPGNKVNGENLRYLPLYTGVTGEEQQGLCIGTENFYAINAKADEASQKAAADFIYWMYSSDKGKQYVTHEFGFIAPFDTFTDADKPEDPLARQVMDWMSREGVTSVPWNFTLFPSQTFKENFGNSLLKYAQGTKDWAQVKADMIADWKKESAAAG